MGIFYFPALALIAAAIMFSLYICTKSCPSAPDKKHRTLDRVGMVTNVILAILYIPLSIIGSFAAMVGEGYMNGTDAQLFLCDLIGLVGFCTPLAAFGGLVVSAKLRNRGLSVKSFLWQFAGIAYFLIIFALMAILDTI